jgi:hypothetical protein
MIIQRLSIDRTLSLSCILLTTGCGKRFDPVLSRQEARAAKVPVITVSRVVESPHFVTCRERGVAVWDKQASSQKIAGPLMAASGRRIDKSEEDKIYRDLGPFKDIEGDIGNSFYEALLRNSPFEDLISLAEVRASGMQDVHYRIDNEIVRRKQDYAGLVRQLNADTVIDLRVVEWSLVRMPISNDIKVRLRVRVKMIRYPQNIVLYYSEHVNEIDERKTGLELKDYTAYNCETLKAQTRIAINQIIDNIIREIVI